jgi:hypothetical protein
MWGKRVEDLIPGGPAAMRAVAAELRREIEDAQAAAAETGEQVCDGGV